MKADFELTPDDLVAFTRNHNLRSPTIQKQRYGCLIGALALLLALPGLILLTTDDPVLETAKAIWPLLLGPVLFVLFIIPYSRWSLAAITKRMLAEGRNSGKKPPDKSAPDHESSISPLDLAEIKCETSLGGLLRHYYREAA